MIAKITKGVRFSGLAVYLHGPGTANEHIYAGKSGGAVIGGNLGAEGDLQGARWAGLLREAAATRPEIDRPVWHVSLRNPPSDRTLSDGEWAMAGQDFAQKMGFEDKPWVMVRHGEDHVHLVVCRVGFDGRVWSRSDDRYKAQRACTAIEADLGLAVAPRESVRASRREADHQISGGEWRRGMRQEKAPQRVVLAEAVRQAAQAATGGGRAGFEVALARVGVEHQVNVASTGRVSGYRFHLPGHVDTAGEAVWFRASQLDKALSWSRLAPTLEGPLPAGPGVVSKGLLEGRKHHAERIESARAQAAAAHLAGVGPRAQAASAGHDRWWLMRVQARAEQVAVRDAIRARAAASLREATHARDLAALSRPTLSPAQRAAAAEWARKEMENHVHRPYRPPPPQPSRGFGR